MPWRGGLSVVNFVYSWWRSLRVGLGDGGQRTPLPGEEGVLDSSMLGGSARYYSDFSPFCLQYVRLKEKVLGAVTKE